MLITKTLDYLRIALYGLLVAVVLFLYQAWDKEHAKNIPSPTTTTTVPNNTAGYVPELTTAHNATTINSNPVINKQHLIHITTDVIKIDIDTLGGNIVQETLLKYPQELHSNTPFLFLNNLPDTRYIAQSGLLSEEGPDTIKGQALYTSDRSDYVLSPDQKELQVKLYWQNAQGIKVTKIFTFYRNDYQIDLNYQIANGSNHAWSGSTYLQLMRTNTPPISSNGLINSVTYFGAAISSPEKRFQKVSFKQIAQQNLNQTISEGWAAMVQHYFVSAWVPDSKTTSQYYSRLTTDGLYTIGMIGSKIEVESGTTVNTQAKFYGGPAVTDKLENVAPGLKLTIDYGWFWFISVIIFWMMQHIYDIVGNWGWSIVIVTLIIKLLFYPLSAKSYRSMSALKNLQPRINAIKERYGDDKQKFTQATLEIYRKEKVNPMNGCLPVLIQIPVFIGLYWVLIESVQLRQAPFIFWIHDLSIRDPYYILNLLVGLSMFLQQRLNPPPPDPMQAKIMALVPLIFTIAFINFPAGLMLYWLVNNVVSFLQQWLIMRKLEHATKSKKER